MNLIYYTIVFIKGDKLSEWFWIGGSDLGSDGQFYWESSGKPFSFTNWRKATAEPNQIGTDHCVEIRATERNWNNLPCDVHMKFVCEHTVKYEIIPV